MCLVGAVDAIAKSRALRSRAVESGQDACMLVLEDNATINAGGVIPRGQKDILGRYKFEYKSGQRWHEMAELFGGPGIVLVFLCASESLRIPDVAFANLPIRG